jgi:hypothetical protein
MIEDNRLTEIKGLLQQANRLSNKSAPVIMLSALLQEAVNLNQQLAQHLADSVTNERQGKTTDSNGGKVPGKAPEASG